MNGRQRIWQSTLNKKKWYHKLADHYSTLTLTLSIPGSGGDARGLIDTLETEGGTCNWCKLDKLEPSPPSVTLSVAISLRGLSQNSIALST